MSTSSVTSFRDLRVWRRSIDLTIETYRLSRLLPRDERFCLSEQIRRAVVSVPANIAEGNGRGSRREYVQFLTIARGSLMELRTEIDIAEALNYVSASERSRFDVLANDVGRMLNSLITRLRAPK